MGKLPPLIIVGNKTDLRPSNPEGEVVSTEEGEEFSEKICEDLDATSVFIETSALTGENIEDAFSALVGMMVEEYKKRQPGYVPKEETPSYTITRDETESVVTETAHTESTETVVASGTADNVSTENAEHTIPTVRSPIDPVTSLSPDSEYLTEDKIGEAMKELNALRVELMQATTRKEWTEAYDEYSITDKRKKDELAQRSMIIGKIRLEIDRVGRVVRQRVGDLEMKKITE